MNDADLLDRLDRRAGTAVDLLDRAVADVPVPLLDLDAAPAVDGAVRTPRPWRSPRLLAIAAAVLAVALVAAVAVAVQDDGSELPIATTGSHRRLVLPPALADDYATVIAAEDLPATLPDLELRVLVPDDAEAPWPDVVVEHVLDAADTTLSGEVVDIGGPEAMFDDESFAPNVGWVDGDTVRYIASTSLGREELIRLAAGIVETRLSAGEVPPGWDLLFTGSYADVVPALSLLAGRPHEASFVAYLDESEQSGLVVSTVRGGPERWRASYAMADEVTNIEVRGGQEAVVARFYGELVEVSWIEEGDTLVRAMPVAARTLDDASVDELVATVEQLVEVDEAEWQRLLAEHPVPDDESSAGSFEGSGEPVGDPDVIEEWSNDAASDPDYVAGVVARVDTFSARAVVRRTPDGGHVLVGEIQGLSSGAGQEQDLDSLAGSMAVTMTDGANLLVYGLVEASDMAFALRAIDGRPLNSAGAWSGTNPNVFVLLVEGATSLDEVGADRVVGVLGDGSEIVIPLR